MHKFERFKQFNRRLFGVCMQMHKYNHEQMNEMTEK